MKRITALICALSLCLSCSAASAARKKVVRDQFYIGAMRVVKCKEYVSLRATPDKTGAVLAQVPLGAIVLYCNNNVRKYAPGKYKKQAELFIRCEYEGQEGYILKKNLQRCVDWSLVDKKTYLEAMQRSVVDGGPIRELLCGALTDKIHDREMFMKGLRHREIPVTHRILLELLHQIIQTFPLVHRRTFLPAAEHAAGDIISSPAPFRESSRGGGLFPPPYCQTADSAVQ